MHAGVRYDMSTLIGGRGEAIGSGIFRPAAGGVEPVNLQSPPRPDLDTILLQDLDTTTAPGVSPRCSMPDCETSSAPPASLSPLHPEKSFVEPTILCLA